MKKKFKEIFDTIFGWCAMIMLFIGGLTSIVYIVGIAIGGDVGTAIVLFLYKDLFVWMAYATSALVLLGMIKMYLVGEMSMTINSGKPKKAGATDGKLEEETESKVQNEIAETQATDEVKQDDIEEKPNEKK